jgi:hypothetical protein|nr:hypothetical protein [Kofleriaceae bacterium]
MTRVAPALALAVASAIGCDSPAGALNANIELIDLDTQQIGQECQYLADTYPQVQATCNGVTTVIGQNVANCNTSSGDVPTTCTATVGQFEDCVSASYSDPCGSGDTVSKACQALDGCGSAL